MKEKIKHITLPKDVATGDDLDYSFLRKKGLEYIEQLSRDLWTDYNSHDPGITILEMLAYAITDLSARIDLPLKDIIASKDEEISIGSQFFKANEIFPSQPVTENDYRKLFIDIDGVKNCWLKSFDKSIYADCKHSLLSYNKDSFEEVDEVLKRELKLQGLYSILVDFDDFYFDTLSYKINRGVFEEKIIDEIRKRYHANRNLCEDLISVEKVGEYNIRVCASIELEMGADEEWIHANVVSAIRNYFSPSIPVYTLQEMKSRGYTTDEIFEGPLLENGFIDNAELEVAELRSEIRLSDIVNLIMNIDGVKVIKDISIQDCDEATDEEDSWLICIDKDKKPLLCDKSSFSYYKDVLPVNVNKAKSESYIYQLAKEKHEKQKRIRLNMTPEIPEGIYSYPEETTTIQNDFPDTYGIGPNGLPPHVGPVRHAEAKQLKGYLLFFDQILSTYFAHLSKIKDIFFIDTDLKSTYFTQAVKDIKGFSEIVIDYPEDNNDKLSRLLLSDLDDYVERKNKLFDHLIGRFAEELTDYAFLMKRLYGLHSANTILQTKRDFLKDYDEVSYKRGGAFNYSQQANDNLWNTANVSGIQKRIARLIGIKDYSRRSLSQSFVELYDFVNSKGEKVFRWRIRNKDNKILLTKTENYINARAAEDEMYFTISKILEMTEEMIEKAFQNNDTNDVVEKVSDNKRIGNFQVKVSITKRYSFNVIDLNANPGSKDYIIARQFTYYNSTKELKRAMLELINFIVTQFSEEGFFLLEHILLRPDIKDLSVSSNQFMPICPEDCEESNLLDPYSYRVTIVLPGWGYRFSNSDFREYLEKLIRQELPAHVLARICWVGYRKKQRPNDKNHMFLFEKAYREFLYTKTNLDQQQNAEKLKALIDITNRLVTIYPSGRLIDCEDENETLKGKIILGRTNIGTI